jgi:zinc protease
MRALTPTLTIVLLFAITKTPAFAHPEDPTRNSHGMMAKAATVKAAPAETTKDPWAGRKDLIQPPKLKPVKALKLPAIKRAKLANGLDVLLLAERDLPLVSMQLLLPVGSIDEPARKIGLSPFVSSMLRQGVKGQTADEMSMEVDAAGVSLSAGSGYELSRISCGGRSQYLDLCLQKVSALVTSPTFPAGEMQEVQDDLKGSVKQLRDKPSSLAQAHLSNMLYGDDRPAGRPLTLESIANIKREDLVAFHRVFYRPNGALLVISGDFDTEAVAAKLEASFKDWQKGQRPPRNIKALAPRKGLSVLLVDKPSLSQSFFALGHEGIHRKASNLDAVQAMNYVLGGGGFSSRMMQVIRSKGGKTYGVSSSFDANTLDGDFSVSTFTRTEETVNMLNLIRAELRRIATEPPTGSELDQAKGKIAGGYVLRFQTGSQLAGALARAQMYELGDKYVTNYPLRINALKTDQLGEAAKSVIHPDDLAIVIVGNAAKVAPLLKAAKIDFEQIAYTDPISAAERVAKLKAEGPITPAEKKAAAKLLKRALKAAGGLKRLKKVKTIRLSGRASMGNIKGSYDSISRPPAHFRVEITTKEMGKMVQAIAGEEAFIAMMGKKRKLPAALLDRMKLLVWRDPILVLSHAAQKGLRLRPNTDGPWAKDKARVALDVWPAKSKTPVTLVFNKKKYQLVEIHFIDATGAKRSSTLTQHKKVKGLLVPHHIAINSEPPQIIEISGVKLNPKLSDADFIAE